jgi:hypothetical protein
MAVMRFDAESSEFSDGRAPGACGANSSVKSNSPVKSVLSVKGCDDENGLGGILYGAGFAFGSMSVPPPT